MDVHRFPTTQGHGVRRSVQVVGRESFALLETLLNVTGPGALEPWRPGGLEAWSPGVLEAWSPGGMQPGALEAWGETGSWDVGR